MQRTNQGPSASTLLTRLGIMAGAFAFCGAAHGQTLTLTIGDHNLQPNQAGQDISFFVNNSGSSFPASFADLYITVGDSTSGPRIEAVDMLTGTPFSLVTSAQGEDTLGNTDYQGFWYAEALVTPATIPAGSVLFATVTFDTTGINSGSWNLSFTTLGETRYANSLGEDIDITIASPGTLTAVPEPAEYAALAGLGCLAWAVYNRRNKVKQAA